jgi:hypothetical protein
MDMSTLKQKADTEGKQGMYNCYQDIYKEFAEVDLSGSVFDNRGSIFTSVSSATEKLRFDNIGENVL